MTNLNWVELTDELGQLDAELKAVDAKIKRRDELKRQLSAIADAELSPDREYTFQTRRYTVVFSKAPKSRTLADVAGFLKAVGIEKFLETITVSVTKADKLLSATQKAELFSEGYGSRRLKAVVDNAPKSEIDPAFESMLKSILG